MFSNDTTKRLRCNLWHLYNHPRQSPRELKNVAEYSVIAKSDGLREAIERMATIANEEERCFWNETFWIWKL